MSSEVKMSSFTRALFDERVRILVDKLLEKERQKAEDQFESLIQAEAQRQVDIRLSPHRMEQINYAYRDTIELVSLLQ